jgi:histidinol-phosphate aminotransferase
MIAPVMEPAAELARKATVPVTSSKSATRGKACILRMKSRGGSLSATSWLQTGERTAAAAAAFEAAGIVVRAFPPEGIRISIGEHEAGETLLETVRSPVRDPQTAH